LRPQLKRDPLGGDTLLRISAIPPLVLVLGASCTRHQTHRPPIGRPDKFPGCYAARVAGPSRSHAWWFVVQLKEQPYRWRYSPLHPGARQAHRWGSPTPSTYYWYVEGDTAFVEVEGALSMSFKLQLWETQGQLAGRLEYVTDVDYTDPVHDVLIGRIWCNR
jgi:hypothetical protein